MVLLLLAACGGGESPTETAIIGALRQPCIGEGPLLCLMMSKDQQPATRQFFGIEGFTHRWGVESEITFYRETVDQPLADGPSENLILLDIVVENEAVTAPFDLEFTSGPGWFSGSGTTLEMLGTTVECTAEICEQLTTADADQLPFEATFELTDDPQKLRATAVSL